MEESLFHVIIGVGEAISGKTVKLVASNDVSLRAATNTSEKLENAKSKGWSVGASISVAGGGILGFDASANATKQKSNTKVTTHTGTTVVDSDAVTITSGKDTHISGSKVIGKSVTADVGGNFSIESLQDTKTYVGESSNKGFSVSTNAGSLSNVSMSSSKGKMKSDYASVTDQAGIYTGDGGFAINTAETTSLTGAVIDSTANSNKNKLSTGSLDVKDVENTAEYTSRNVGMSYNHVGNFKNLSKAGKDAVWNTLGTLPNLLPDSSKSSSSTTKSAISNGTIEARDANFNMQTLSRDTNTSLNKLDEIFDKKKIEERQELSKLFAKEAFGQLHNWNPTSKEGKAAKAIAHGVVAEVSARMAGNKPGSGFYAGATNEALIGEIQKIAKEKPDVAQSLSALLGAAVNGSLGYSPVTGAAEAQYGTKWNQLSDGQIEYLKSAILQNLDNNGSVEELIRILENGATLGYVQEAGNSSSRKNADGSYTTRAEDAMYADDMFLGVKGLGTRITNKLGINYHVTLMEKDISLGTTIILDEMATLARAKYSNGSNNKKFIFVDTSDKVSVMPVSESKSTFVWTKDALGKSVAQNMLSEVGNQPWTGYVYYAENTSKFTQTVAKVGGPVSIGFLLNDMQNDYQMYSGRELAKAWSANLIPVGLGIGSGFVGGLAAGPAGAFAIGVTGATLGDRVKDEIKFNLKKDVDK